MTPVRKYEKYGRFPWKLIIHMLLVVFTTCQVILVVNRGTTYAYSQYALWNSLFLNHNIQGSTNPIVNSYIIFSSDSVAKYVATSVHRYYDVNSITIDNYDFHYKSDGTISPPKLHVKYFDNAKSMNKGYKIEYSLYNNNLGPFSINADDFLDELKEFKIEYNIIHNLNRYVDTSSDCYSWKIIQNYDYSSHGVVTTSLDTYRASCHTQPCNWLFSLYFWKIYLTRICNMHSFIIIFIYSY